MYPPLRFGLWALAVYSRWACGELTHDILLQPRRNQFPVDLRSVIVVVKPL